MMIMINKLRDLIICDLFRYGIKRTSALKIFRLLLFSSTPGVRFMVCFRILNSLKNKSRLIAAPFFLYYKHLKIKFGFDISYRTRIGRGFYIGHFGGIVVHGDAVIGENCNISQGVTIGISNHGPKAGTPVIGNNVFIGPGAVILGAIKIGDNVTIGANCVVNTDLPDFSTAIAQKITVVNKDLSEFYINNRIN
jgi:serine O-acetyltransferase